MQAQTQKIVKNFFAIAFLTQAIIIGIRGNLDVLSGKPILNVLPWMITQAIELIIKVHRTQKSIEENDRPSQPRITPNPHN
ncbi:MAG: hypothetical protein ACM65L_08265 [Microcoleus sp.]